FSRLAVNRAHQPTPDAKSRARHGPASAIGPCNCDKGLFCARFLYSTTTGASGADPFSSPFKANANLTGNSLALSVALEAAGNHVDLARTGPGCGRFAGVHGLEMPASIIIKGFKALTLEDLGDQNATFVQNLLGEIQGQL